MSFEEQFIQHLPVTTVPKSLENEYQTSLKYLSMGITIFGCQTFL